MTEHRAAIFAAKTYSSAHGEMLPVSPFKQFSVRSSREAEIANWLRYTVS